MKFRTMVADYVEQVTNQKVKAELEVGQCISLCLVVDSLHS